MARIVFLNALPLNAITVGEVTIYGRRLSVEGFVEDVRRELCMGVEAVECYIRHPATVELLNKLFERNNVSIKLEPSQGLYQWMEGDLLYVITLKQPQRGVEKTEVSDTDIEIWRVRPYTGCLIP